MPGQLVLNRIEKYTDYVISVLSQALPDHSVLPCLQCTYLNHPNHVMATDIP